MQSPNPNAKVYGAICNVMHDVAKEGIAKNSRNQQQGYNFRSIDAVYNALSPILSKHHLVILPRIVTRTETERQTKSGSVMFSVVVEAEFALCCSDDNSSVLIKTYGEAMDSGDKATNKAMSAAYKYACMQAFCIPTEGDNDADATTHEPIQSRQPSTNGTNLSASVIFKDELAKLLATQSKLWGENLDQAKKEMVEYAASAVDLTTAELQQRRDAPTLTAAMDALKLATRQRAESAKQPA